MKIVDLNLLIYAINRDAPDHAKAREWWENCLSGTETVGLPWVVILGFLRIATNSKIMPKPLTHSQAIEYIANKKAPPLEGRRFFIFEETVKS